MGASVPKSATQVHDDAVANQRKVGDVLPQFHYKLPKDGKTGIDLRGFTVEQFSKLTSQGFKLHHLVSRSLSKYTEKRDQPKAMIPMFIYTYAALQELKHKQKSHICVISGDPDLASTIARLVDRDHTVVAAVPQGSDYILRELSIEAWY
ncbi:hypothetical protein F2Q69_00045690 [Brassica cretica]|uniref:NYN domain-containing protein n=1 Tax=Brassica cretica TaxID=69181 RepID=A0A8S9N743_BRACR|nr:hypothetical protein F2Q69_00045690 [Brassica cretica]